MFRLQKPQPHKAFLRFEMYIIHFLAHPLKIVLLISIKMIYPTGLHARGQSVRRMLGYIRTNVVWNDDWASA